jgi:hypothetical protein
MVVTVSRLTPGAFRSTMCSQALRPPFVATTAKSAMSPSGTASFVPVRRPAATECSSFVGSAGPGCSAMAKVPMISPDASFGSQCCFCFSEPNSMIASVAR